MEDFYDDNLKKLVFPAAYVLKFHLRKAGEPRSNRDEQLEVFLHRINASRVAAGYPKYTYGRLVAELKRAGFGTNDIYALAKRCDSYRSFSAGYNHQLHVRRKTAPAAV